MALPTECFQVRKCIGSAPVFERLDVVSLQAASSTTAPTTPAVPVKACAPRSMPNAPVKPGVILASLAHLATTKRKPDFLRLAWISRRPEAITAALKASIRALLLDLSSAGFCGRGLCALLMLWGLGGEADANLSTACWSCLKRA